MRSLLYGDRVEKNLEAVVSIPGLIAQSLLVARSDAIIAADRDGVICFWNFGADASSVIFVATRLAVHST
jgi:hypothetical protein